MAVTDHRGHGDGVDPALTEGLDDDPARVELVILVQLRLAQMAGAGDRAVEIVGVRGAVTGDVLPGLGPAHRVGAVGVDDAADRREGLVEHQMGLRVGGGVQLALDALALEIHDHHVLGPQLLILHAGGLDNEKTALPVDAADVAPGVGDQPAAGQLHIRLVDLALEFFQHSASSRRYHLWLFAIIQSLYPARMRFARAERIRLHARRVSGIVNI